MLARIELNTHRANFFVEPYKKYLTAIKQLIKNIELERNPHNPEVRYAHELQACLLQRYQDNAAVDIEQLNRAKIIVNLLTAINSDSKDVEIAELKKAVTYLKQENSTVMLGLLHARQREIDPDAEQAILYYPSRS